VKKYLFLVAFLQKYQKNFRAFFYFSVHETDSIICGVAFIVFFSFAETDPRLEQGARFAAVGNFDKALAEYRAILADDPKSAKAYFGAAEVRYKMKDYSGAIANYRLAYRWNPDKVAAYEGAAKAFEALGDKVSAAEERKKMPKMPDFAEPGESVKETKVAEKVQTTEKKEKEAKKDKFPMMGLFSRKAGNFSIPKSMQNSGYMASDSGCGTRQSRGLLFCRCGPL
jgi:tetratricopeptide (TPR) repeat protein